MVLVQRALNQTALDPGFGTGLGSVIPEDAGWFNGTPGAPQSVEQSGTNPAQSERLEGIAGYAIQVAQLVVEAERTSADCAGWSGLINFTAEVGFNTGLGTTVFFGKDTLFDENVR